MPDPATLRYPELSRDEFNKIIREFHQIYVHAKFDGVHVGAWHCVKIHTYVFLIKSEFDIAY